MALMTCGIALGFVLAFALFVQKIWNLKDRLDEERFKAKYYRKECEKLARQVAEWETAKCDAQDVSFKNF